MNMLDRWLDASVVLSYGRQGFARHRRHFDPGDLSVDLGGRVALITGASSGLGLATALALARLGATVLLLCRDEARGQAALAAVTAAGGRAELVLADLSSLRSLRALAARFPAPRLDILVHNAGVLPPRRTTTEDGLELTWATHVVGPFTLTALLLPRLRASPSARVIHVSSGGMLTQRLDLTDVDWRHRRYDGVLAYAQSKRAQVTLAELWAERLAPSAVRVHSMHPGWADTPAVRSSLPRFHRLTRGILRSPEEGADTIVWLAACPRLAHETGQFWFDRQPAKTHVLPFTRESPEDRQRLWALCLAQSGLAPAAVS